MSNDRFYEAVNYFKSVGYSGAQAAGIAGNLAVESTYKGQVLNPNAVGDGGAAYGIAQWHPNRQADFKAKFGKDIRNSTYQEQLQFVAYELQNKESAANAALLKTTNIQDATRVFMNKYERPANSTSYNARLNAATKAYNIGVSGAGANPIGDALNKLPDFVKKAFPFLIGPSAGAPVIGNEIGGAIANSEPVQGAIDKFLGYIPRLVAILIGIALIIIALVVLLGDKVNVEQLIPAK